ncbi:MAG: GNAT family N-acetyltransferase [Aromatoleum sp.]|nr:GNAT family N-acetyltransferase [Aromatoleum sp.]
MDFSPAPALAVARHALRWQCSRLPQLAPADLYAVMALRQQVFVVEQSCAFVDADGFDVGAWHLLGWAEGPDGRQLAAYLRVVDPGGKYPEPSIGRVVTAPAHRRTGLGRALMAEGIARTAAAWPGRAIRISAQQHLEEFYASLGFHTVSAPYDEDGIAHVEMLHNG